MPVTWLHVSDFHFRPVDSYDRNAVLQALVEAVDRFRQQGRKPDLIFATGDIGYSGQAGDYQSAGQFFNALLLAAGLEKRHLFVVPGNHDVDRKGGKGLCRTLSSSDEADHYFDPDEPAPHIEKRLRNFVDWYNNYFDGIRRFPEDTTCGPVELVIVDHFRLAVLPLNSALFCCADDDHAKLWLGHRCLKTAVASLKDKYADLNLALIHHPLHWLAGEEASKVNATLEETVDVLLRGHLHENEAGTWTTVSGAMLHLAAGAAYQTRHYPNRALYVTVDQGESRIFPIHYVDSPREAWVHDTSLFFEASNGEGVLTLPRRAKSRAVPSPQARILPPPQEKKTENRRRDSGLRFLALKARLREALSAPDTARQAIERQMPPLSLGRNDDGFIELAERLLAMTFEDGKNVLLASLDELRQARDNAGLEALGTISRLLIPWLYVASNNLLTGDWERVALGRVLNLPAGLETFAELIMAGIDRRELAYQKLTGNDWPPGVHALTLQQPESGMIDATEENLREDLFQRFRPSPRLARRPAADRDKIINDFLEHALNRDGIRYYLVCYRPEGNGEERKAYVDLTERIAKRYPSLAVLRLDPDWEISDNKNYIEIRDVLYPSSERA